MDDAGSRQRRPPVAIGLDRETILAAAEALLEEVGLSAFTMRGLAARLGCTDMTLYHYYPSRDALLDALLERLLSEVSLDEEEPDWLTALANLQRELWGLFRKHPQALAALLARPLTLPAIAHCLQAGQSRLIAEGFAPSTARQVLSTLTSYTLGYASLTCGGYLSMPAEGQPEAPAQAPRTRSRKPKKTSCPGMAGTPDWTMLEQGYETGLVTLLTGLRETTASK